MKVYRIIYQSGRIGRQTFTHTTGEFFPTKEKAESRIMELLESKRKEYKTFKTWKQDNVWMSEIKALKRFCDYWIEEVTSQMVERPRYNKKLMRL